MNGLDTNILLRFFLPDDVKQGKAAKEFLTRHCTPQDPGFVNLIVLCELVWTLERAYRLPRSDIAKLISAMLANRALVLEARDQVTAALQRFEASSMDFPDLLIGGINRAQGCETTITFDRKAAKLDGFRLLS